MNNTHKRHIRSIASLAGFLAIVAVSSHNQQFAPAGTTMQMNTAWTARVGSQRVYDRMQQKQLAKNSTFEERIAMRMQQRLRKGGMHSAPTMDKLVGAVKQRQTLLGKHIAVTFQTEENPEYSEWDVSAQRYPLWLKPNFSATVANYMINKDQVVKSFEDESILNVTPPTQAVITQIIPKEDDKHAGKAVIEGTAKAGYLPDTDLIASSIAKAFDTDLDAIAIPLQKQEGRLINATTMDLGDLTLWATGESDYKGSTWARKFNVQKALNEHVQNTYVAPGETFSFNSTLDGPVSQGNGWAMAKVIYNGGDLEYAPGGGICQASTTVFRAAVNAGFPIVDRRAHSLYVSYYKQGGVGIDATIYPGTQDLSFVNDTDKPLIIQAYNDGTKAYVNVYGTPDGRTVELKGPYFASTAPSDFTYNGRSLKDTEIVWDQTVHYPSGTERLYQISSRYRTLPKSVAREFSVPEEKVYASAPIASLQ